MELARLHRLTYRYPAAVEPALREVSLVLGGGLTHVWGPSGGGKSTLLRVLNGLVPHFHGGTWRGRAEVDGLDVVATPTRVLARRVGFVFQDPERQAVASTVEREVAFALENAGVAAGDIGGRVLEALDRLGAGELAGRRLETLSGGERQRVEIAAAVALRPRLLVLDEPASQLDAEGAEAVARTCRALARAGLAVVFAEHRAAPADRHLRVAEGRVDEAQPGPVPPPRARRSRPRAGAAWTATALVAGVAGRPLVEVPALAGRPGEVLALTGPNGGGKTTLLRTLAGLARPLAGTVERAAGRAAYLPQDPTALLHRPTVADEVDYTLRLAHRAGGGAEMLRAFDLTAVAGRYPRDLSGGQRERAALAAVLAGGPTAVFLDEPTRGMDARARDLLLAALDDLALAGAAIVVATHDADLVATADRVLVVADGRACEREAVA